MQKIKILLSLFVILIMPSSYANTWKEDLKLGEETTAQNYLNVPFVKPKNWKTTYTIPSNWPTFENRGPLDRSPKDKPSKVITLGTGDPNPNPNRYGPAHVVIVNGYPYFIDCGEGWWRALAKTILSQGNMDLVNVFKLENLKYMFLTHLHEDHTVGLPSFINNPFKFGTGANKKVYGPKGVDKMIGHINAAWSIDRNEMFQGSVGTKRSTFDGATAVGIPIDPAIGATGRKIFEDENVEVYAYPTKHGNLKHTYAYRFITKPDNRIIVFGGDGHYSKGLVAAAKDADVLIIEGFTFKNMKYSPWGGETLNAKFDSIKKYHMFPIELKLVQEESKVKEIVLVHTQNYNNPENFKRLGLLQEMIDAGVKNVLQAQDGDMY
ncbi:MBL fold metallo-hydrolase [Thiotrichales bacterium 19S9-12]|nr:MBL fold metallo-hydrolase [Thiotrichales bacterium 19S9-11]MCF6810768.1 MBL fold metallo-hydrolase [Thiotrichales bacterium 19S9-12]